MTADNVRNIGINLETDIAIWDLEEIFMMFIAKNLIEWTQLVCQRTHTCHLYVTYLLK